MARIFVTGGTGFIGSEAVRRLSVHNECIVLTRRGTAYAHNCRYVMGEAGNREKIKTLLKEFKADTLLHLAWNVKAADFSVSEENKKWVVWSKSLVEDFLDCGGRNVIASGTCFEYDWNGGGVLTENSKCKPATPYGECKIETYKALKDLCAKSGARFVWGRVFYPYGPREEKRKLISAAINTLRQGEIFDCRTPENRIDYIHVDDAAGAFAALTENESAQGVYNICTGKAVRVGDILQYAAEKLGAKDKLRLLEGNAPVAVAGSNRAMLQAGCVLKYPDIQSGIDTYFNL